LAGSLEVAKDFRVDLPQFGLETLNQKFQTKVPKLLEKRGHFEKYI